VNRDMTLLVSRDAGKTFRDTMLQKWQIAECPMSSESLVQNGNRVLAAWETRGEVFRTSLDAAKNFDARNSDAKFEAPLPAPDAQQSRGERKHPLLLANKNGDTLFAWTEGTGWMKGGALAWQVYDKTGRAAAAKGRTDGVPVWGSLAGYAQPNGDFVLLY
jgi:hypothetical protein